MAFWPAPPDFRGPRCGRFFQLFQCRRANAALAKREKRGAHVGFLSRRKFWFARKTPPGVFARDGGFLSRGGFLAGSVRFSESTRRSIVSTFSASRERGTGKAREERCPRWFSVSPQILVRTKSASGSLRARRWLSEPRGGFLAGSVRFSESRGGRLFQLFQRRANAALAKCEKGGVWLK